jgi:hypothetical protein
MYVYKGIKVYTDGDDIPENFEDIFHCISSDLGNTKVNKIRIKNDDIHVELKNNSGDKTWMTVKMNDEIDEYISPLIAMVGISLFLIFLV